MQIPQEEEKIEVVLEKKKSSFFHRTFSQEIGEVSFGFGNNPVEEIKISTPAPNQAKKTKRNPSSEKKLEQDKFKKTKKSPKTIIDIE